MEGKWEAPDLFAAGGRPEIWSATLKGLGLQREGGMTIDLELLRKRLVEMKAALERDESIGEAERAPVDLDQTSVGRLSRMDAIQVQAMALASQQRRKAELDRVNAALARIGDEDFGYCAACGEAIAEARLANDPSVATCIRCAK